MYIREKLRANPIFAVIGSVLAFGLAGFLLYLNLRPPDKVGKSFFTNDDGKTWFVDRADLPVPVQRDGKEVVMAQVFTINGEGKPFVKYMRRYTPEALDRLKKRQPGAAPTAADAFPLRMEYKVPGDTKWHDLEGNFAALADYLKMTDPRGDLVEVSP